MNLDQRALRDGCVLLALFVMLAACGRSNLLEGRVEAQVGDHVVVVTDCYRTTVPAPQRLDDTAAGAPSYRFAPCRDAVVELQGAQIVVNGVSYGAVEPGDTITVDHGRVLINDREATATTNRGESSTATTASAPN